MTALNNGYTVQEYQPDQTSFYLKAVKSFNQKSPHSTTVIQYKGTTPSLSGEARKILGRLEEFKSLQDNWDSYHAARPSIETVRQAEKMVQRLDAEGIAVFFTAPGPNGEIVLELKCMHKAVEIYFYANSPSDFVLFDGDRTVDEGLTNEAFDQIINFIL
jgi:hypothetical protein